MDMDTDIKITEERIILDDILDLLYSIYLSDD
jgi:hypothetical protein